MSEQAGAQEPASSAVSAPTPDAADEAAAMAEAVALVQGKTEESEAATQEQPPAEPSAEGAAKGEEQPKTPLDRSFAALTKQEARVREQVEQLKAEREEFDKSAADALEIQRLAKEDPYALLDRFGIDFAKWAASSVGKGKESGPDQQVAELAKQVEDLKAQLSEKVESDNQSTAAAQKKNYLDEVNNFLQGKEQFELLAAKPDSGELVFDLVQRHYEASERVMSYEEAATLLEKALEEELDAIVSKSSRLQKKYGGQPSSKTTPSSGEQDTPEPRTVSNNLASAAAPRVSGDAKSEEELMAESLAMLRG